MSEDGFVSDDYTRPGCPELDYSLEAAKTLAEIRGRTGLLGLAEVVVEKGG